MQQSLIDKGYDAGPVDGVLGFRTRAAKKVASGVEKAVTTDRDRGDREKK